MLWLWIVAAAGAVLTALCFLLKKKLGKRRFANALMVVAILVAAAVGLGFARYWMPQEQAQLGSLYKITPIAGDRLVTSENAENLCTITIRCDTILDHQKKLEHSKIPYVPSDGVILPTITVEFAPGETVFDVLKRVCEAADILLEYSWTPLYDSYYLEGIGHLYEYDCGTESGWMYQVNGLYPNYGCSSYELQPGDAIGWNYTCVGQGADLGTEGMKKEK